MSIASSIVSPWRSTMIAQPPAGGVDAFALGGYAPGGMTDLPTDTVTFLFTDIEGSTRLLERHPEAYPHALRRHHQLLQDAVESQDGAVFELGGDAVYAAFARPSCAVEAALQAQLALLREPWGPIG